VRGRTTRGSVKNQPVLYNLSPTAQQAFGLTYPHAKVILWDSQDRSHCDCRIKWLGPYTLIIDHRRRWIDAVLTQSHN